MSKINRPYARGYSDAGASRTRRALQGFIPNSSDPKEDINLNNATLRQRARMLYMSAPMATSGINTMRTKAVGTGLELKAAVDRDVLGLSPEAAERWQRKTEAEFRLWAERRQNCDALGLNNFVELQQLAAKSWLLSGDVFALMKREKPNEGNPYGLRVQLVEADRICTPNRYDTTYFAGLTEAVIPEGMPGAGHKVYDGVEVDEGGRVVAYHISSRYPNAATLTEKIEWTRVKVYGKSGMPNILHLMEAERPDQYRGVSYLAQVIEPLLQLRRYTESDLTAAIIQSFFTAAIVTESTAQEFPINEVGGSGVGGLPGENPDGINRGENDYELGPGTVLHLQPGENIQFGNPNIPTAGFESFTKALCRQIGAALEIPYDVLMKEFDSSYSASRGALLEAWEAVKMRRSWFVNDFCQPIYELWLSEAIARGRVKAPGYFDDPLIRAAWSGAKWIGPVQGQLDPKKEIQAALMAAGYGIKTYEQITRELGGGDWDDNMDRLTAENQRMRDAGCAGFAEDGPEEEIDE